MGAGFAVFVPEKEAQKVVQIAKKNGVDLTDQLQLESIGKLTNSLTGRGSLG